MQAKQQRRKFYALGCGGRHYIRIQRCIVGHAMHAKGLVDPRRGMNFR